MNSDNLSRIPARHSACLLRLILVRHGQPVDDVRGRCYGKLDIGLSLAGRRQVRERLEVLRDLKPEALYTSTCRRAFDSAEEIGKDLELEVKSSAELCEIDFGAFEGLTYSEIEDRYPDEFKQWMERPMDIKFPEGENFQEMRDRVLKFLEFLFQAHRGQTVLTISHAGVNRLILANALGLISNNMFRIDQAYAALNVIDYFQDYALVRLING